MNQDQLEKLIKKQKRLKDDYQSLLDDYNIKDIISENEKLRQELRKYERELADLKEQVYNLRNRNDQLRLSLRKQIIDERIKLLKISRQKLKLYFSVRANDYKDRLTALEDEVKNKLSKLKKKVEASLSNDKEDLITDIEQLNDKIDSRIKYRKRQFEEERTEIKNYYQQGQEDLTNREVEDKDIEKRQEENDLTEQTSLQWIKRLGIIVIVVNLVLMIKYAYDNFFNQGFKIGISFLLSLINLGLGESILQSRKQSQGKMGQLLLTVGIAIAYFATLKWWTDSFIAFIIVNLVALYLVYRHYSQPVLAMTLAGGYSPIAVKVLAMLKNNLQVPRLELQLSVIYTLASFITFSLLIIYVLNHYHSLFQLTNKILLGVNNLIGFLLIYGLLSHTYFAPFLAIIPVAFILFYVVLDHNLALDKYSNLEWKRVFKLFNLMFLILIPVVQLGVRWWALGWLLEGVVIAIYVLKIQNEKITKYSKQGQVLNYFKYFAVISGWCYLIYFSLQSNIYPLLLAVIINFIAAYGLQNIAVLNDKLIDYISVFYYLIGDLLCIYSTLNSALIADYSQLQKYLYWGLLLVINILLVINLRQLLIALLEKYKFNFEVYPLLLGNFSALYVTVILINQFGLSISSIVITMLYLVVASLFLLYGSYRNFVYSRLMGLFILIIVAIKFFVYDLSFLTGLSQLGAYLGLGSCLLVIYVIYKKLKNKLAN